MKNVVTAALSASLVMSLAACASAPTDIQASYTPSTRWQGMSCQQLADETSRIGFQVDKVTGQQLQKRRTDQTAMGVGLVLFWPALIAMPLTKDHKAELARLKGEYEAVQRESEANRCGAGGPPIHAAVAPTPVAPPVPASAPPAAPAPVVTKAATPAA